MNNKIIAIAMIVLVTASFITGFYSVLFTGSQNSQNNNAYDLTLVITNVSSPNKTLASQDAFFVLQNGSLTSSAVIRVPFGTLVRITIINHDNGIDSPLVHMASNVTGVRGNSMSVYSGISVSNSDLNTGTGSTSYSDVPAADISHTFTTSTGLNMPIMPHSTEVGYTYFNSAGTYTWGCMCECGPYSMNSPGWMMGAFIVLSP